MKFGLLDCRDADKHGRVDFVEVFQIFATRGAIFFGFLCHMTELLTSILPLALHPNRHADVCQIVLPLMLRDGTSFTSSDPNVKVCLASSASNVEDRSNPRFL